jgi:hypothetical protein
MPPRDIAGAKKRKVVQWIKSAHAVRRMSPICRRTCSARNSRNAAPAQNHGERSTGQTASILPAKLLKVNFRGGKDYPCEQLQAALVFASDDFARGKQRGVSNCHYSSRSLADRQLQMIERRDAGAEPRIVE